MLAQLEELREFRSEVTRLLGLAYPDSEVVACAGLDGSQTYSVDAGATTYPTPLAARLSLLSRLVDAVERSRRKLGSLSDPSVVSPEDVATIVSHVGAVDAGGSSCGVEVSSTPRSDSLGQLILATKDFDLDGSIYYQSTSISKSSVSFLIDALLYSTFGYDVGFVELIRRALSSSILAVCDSDRLSLEASRRIDRCLRDGSLSSMPGETTSIFSVDLITLARCSDGVERPCRLRVFDGHVVFDVGGGAFAWRFLHLLVIDVPSPGVRFALQSPGSRVCLDAGADLWCENFDEVLGEAVRAMSVLVVDYARGGRP